MEDIRFDNSERDGEDSDDNDGQIYNPRTLYRPPANTYLQERARIQHRTQSTPHFRRVQSAAPSQHRRSSNPPRNDPYGAPYPPAPSSRSRQEHLAHVQAQTRWGSPTPNQIEDDGNWSHPAVVDNNPAWEHPNDDWHVGDSSTSSNGRSHSSYAMGTVRTEPGPWINDYGHSSADYKEEPEYLPPLPGDPPPAYSRRDPQKPKRCKKKAHTNPFRDSEFRARYGL